MEKKIIQFKGMSNAPDDQVAQDGQMAVLLNARIKNGEIVPTREDLKIEISRTANVKKVVFHQERLLELRLDGKIMVFPSYKAEFHNESMSNAFKSVQVDDFAIMGNMVILFGMDGDTYYVLWRGSYYKFLGTIPKVSPSMNISKKTLTLENLGMDFENPDAGNFFKNSRLGYVNKAYNNVYDEKGYIDRAMFISTLTLVDDTKIITDSMYCELASSDIGPNNFVITRDNKMTINYFKLNVYGGTVSNDWKDLIKSIDIYSTGSIPSYKEADVEHLWAPGLTGYKTKTFRDIVLKGRGELYEELENALFYKIGTISDGKYKELTDSTSPSVLAVQEVFYKTANQNITKYKGMTYNNRLHAYYIEKKLSPDVFPLRRIIAGENGTNLNVHIQTCIKEGELYSEVASKKYDIKDLSPVIFSYNDDVEKLAILTRDGFLETDKEGTTIMGAMFKSHSSLSISHFYELKGFPRHQFPFEKLQNALVPGRYSCHHLGPRYGEDLSMARSVIKGIDCVFWETPITGFSATNEDLEFTVTTGGDFLLSPIKPNRFFNTTYGQAYDKMTSRVKDYNKQRNILKVSLLDNPFCFPNEQTYKFDGDIVAVKNTAETVSQGQFGQYPLYVFTTDGIWAMQVDTSGKTAYISQAQVSREVCTGGVCAINDGIAFTTNKGIMVIKGEQTAFLSDALDGLRCEMFENSYSLLSAIGDRGAGMKKAVPIREYVKGAKLGYNNNENELLVFNPGFDYSYVYNTSSNLWKMCDKSYEETTEGVGPLGELILYKGENDDRYIFRGGEKNNPILAITRPLKTDLSDYKRLRQVALRTTFKGSLNFYVLGSNDGANFVCITGKEYPSKNGNEPTDVTRRDLVTTMSRSRQYKYFAIAIAGNMEGRISMAELLMDAGFANNQLR